MIDVNRQISRLIHYGLQKKLIEKEDIFYTANRLLFLLKATGFKFQPADESLPHPSEILNSLCDYAVQTGVLQENHLDIRDWFDTELMNCLMPRPSDVTAHFYSEYKKDPEKATSYFYDISRASNYIRMDRIEKDQKWNTSTAYGDMIITINLSKPEKDPKAIAAAKLAPQSGYPKCALCRENEGFTGSPNQAARATHRLIPFSLCGKDYFIQYSPYVYYPEHCIILNREHKPMKVDRPCLDKLLHFTDFLPHYFIGSNADLPIVGGSILSHDHFQSGCFDFPMAKAGVRLPVSFAGYEDIQTGIVHWPMSVLRLRGRNQDRIAKLADKILLAWRGYSDDESEVLAFTGDIPHNTITPIARRRGEDYEMDLVLRNNRTTQEHPMGIFHPHAEYHHIKRENIGLIEVMGMAILPPRLLQEMNVLKEALLHPEKADSLLHTEDMQKHLPWYESLKMKARTKADVSFVIQNSIGIIFRDILSNAGVFKDTPAGMTAFQKFCSFVSTQPENLSVKS